MDQASTILIVDDEPNLRRILAVISLCMPSFPMESGMMSILLRYYTNGSGMSRAIVQGGAADTLSSIFREPPKIARGGGCDCRFRTAGGG